ncbi:hypothetical protein Q8A73_000016 [Channa argus]|nr:hypothetical protein Q8A73_000016 [Channa argus]
MVIFLATTVSMAPVEEKEQEEVEATEEGELSEEEEDDDDSQSQDRIEVGNRKFVHSEHMIPIAPLSSPIFPPPHPANRTPWQAADHHGSSVWRFRFNPDFLARIQTQINLIRSDPHPEVSTSLCPETLMLQVSGPGAQAGGGQTQEGAAGSSAAVTPSSSAASQPTGSPGSAEAEAEHLSVPAGQPQPAGSEGVRSESNCNGQKLLNGGGGGGGGGGQADTQTDFLGLFGGEDTHLEYTGTMDSSTHDFLLGLMGGGNRFGPEVHINVPVITSGVTAGPYSDQSSSFGLNSSVSTDPAPTDPGHHTDQARPGPTSLTLGPDLSQSSSFPGSSDSAVNGSSSSSHSEAHNEQTDIANSPDANYRRNGPQTHLTDTNAATDRPVSFTELTGGTVSRIQVDLTAVMAADRIINQYIDHVNLTQCSDCSQLQVANWDMMLQSPPSSCTQTLSMLSQFQIQQEVHWTTVRSLNSSTHLVRVLKVQKMWNWRIPADFHIKPQVRFLRYQFQCTGKSNWPGTSDPSL